MNSPTCRFDAVSFCLITDGRQIDKTSLALESIRYTCSQGQLDYQIIVTGATEAILEQLDVRLFPVDDPERMRRLGALRNLAADRAKHGVLVFVDDDIIFSNRWATRLVEFSERHDWDIIGNRILFPNGDRCWDRATIRPHVLVDYDHPKEDNNLYQTGGFVVMRRHVFDAERWNDDLEFYAERAGGTNEDIEYSRRLIDRGFDISFDRENLVWHWDERFRQVGKYITKVDPCNPGRSAEFVQLIDQLRDEIGSPYP